MPDVAYKVVDLTDSIGEIYARHGANQVLSSALTDCSAATINTSAPDDTLARLAKIYDNRSKLLTSPDITEDFVFLATLGFLASTGFIFMYRGNTGAARQNFEEAVQEKHKARSETTVSYIQTMQEILDQLDLAQRIVTESREDLNRLRQEHDLGSLDGQLLKNFDKYVPILV